MSSSLYLNTSGRQTFDGGRIRSPRESERSGSATARSNDSLSDKVRKYSIEVKDGKLKITTPPRKVR